MKTCLLDPELENSKGINYHFQLKRIQFVQIHVEDLNRITKTKIS